MIENFTNKYEVFFDVSLLKYNTYKLDVKCKCLIFPKDIEELIDILKIIKKNNYKYYILGNGSNVIFKNDYFDGVIIKLDRFNKVNVDNDIITSGCGVSLMKLSSMAIKENLSGLEFAYGIPGLVGASVAMNAGAYKKDLSDILVSVRLLDKDLNVIEMKKEELAFSYRNSILKNNKDYIVLECIFKLTEGNKEEMMDKVNKRRQKRLLTQPLEFPSAGSVFRNPDGMFAGELIEKCNLKGYNINGAEVSEKHANFIINKGGAKGEDIIKLINVIKLKVKEEFNVDLYLEQIITD